MSILQRITTSPSTSYMSNWYWASDRFLPKTGTGFNQSSTVWAPNTAYAVGDIVTPTADRLTYLSDGANNIRTDYATQLMTSNVLPSPQVASSTGDRSSSYYPYLAFNQTGAENAWMGSYSASETIEQSLMVDMGTSVIVNKYSLTARALTPNYPKDFKLQGSNTVGCAASDAISANGWTDLDTRTGETSNAGVEHYYTFINSTAYRYYRIRITKFTVDNGYVSIAEWKLVASPLFSHRCIRPGTSDASTQPTWAITENGLTTDGTATWIAYNSDTVAYNRHTVTSPAVMQVDVGGTSLTNLTQQTLDLSLDTNWDHGQSIGTWAPNTAYSVGDLVRPTAAWLGDGANNASTAYATDKMLSNTIPGPGVASASSTYDIYYPSKAFDQILTTASYWTAAVYPSWICFDFGRSVAVNKFRYHGTFTGYDILRWIFQGSDDNTSWTDLLDRTGSDVTAPGNNWTSYFTFSNSHSYRYYRLYVTAGQRPNVFTITELHLVSTPSLVYRCTVAGTSHASTHPTMPVTEGATVTESGSTLQWTAYLDNTVAVNRKGVDYYIYACTPTSGSVPKLLLSKQSTYPLGYTASNSRKIAGFHCLCEYVGSNTYGTTAHSLYGYVAGDILPASVWDLRWKSNSLIGNVGQVYDAGRQIWCAIYHPSGTSTAPTIVLGGTILDTIDWNNSVDACAVLGMRLARDSEFQSVAAGSNEQTKIYGGADPITVGGYVDTAGTRMISNIGVEGAVGQMWQWLDEQSYRFDAAASHTHAWTVDGNAQSNIVSAAASGDLAPAWGWQATSGSKGSIYKQGSYGTVKLCAGLDYDIASQSGSSAREMRNSPWLYYSWLSFRPVARHIVKEYI